MIKQNCRLSPFVVLGRDTYPNYLWWQVAHPQKKKFCLYIIALRKEKDYERQLFDAPRGG